MLQDQRVRLALGAIGMAVLGALIALVLAPEQEEATGAQAVVRAGKAATVALPATVADALAANWNDLGPCNPGRGRYFDHLDEQGVPDPLVLAFNADDELAGVYVTSRTAMPVPPWEHMPSGLAGVPNYSFEHWSLPVYYSDTAVICTRTKTP